MGELIQVISDHLGWVLLFAFAVIAVTVNAARDVAKATARERTRREIAAYIAEGSITPEHGQRLMGAGETRFPRG